MQRSTRRLTVLLVALVAFLIAAALVYQSGMGRLEGRPRTFFQSLEWAAETLTTTGYGADNRWSHPAMVLFVIAVQMVGLLFVIAMFPIFVIPFLEERFEEKLPRDARRLRDHVIVYRWGPAVETLVQRLAEHGVTALVVETDEAAARTVLEIHQHVVFSRAEEDALDVVNLGEARAIVANGHDEENAAIVLRARQMGFRRDIFAFVAEPTHLKPIELTGATAAYTPRHIVAAALAAHASDRLSPRVPGVESIGGIVRREVRVPPASPFAGQTLREAQLWRTTGANVVGQWSRSRLESRCTGDLRIEPGGMLEIIGDEDAVARAADRLGGVVLRSSGFFLIAGFGEVGRKVAELLTDAGEEVRVVERLEMEGVDVVGNVLDPSVLERAGIHDCRGAVLALNTDDATLFASVIVRDVAPDVPVIARVNHSRNLDNMHRAGADYALSISDISGGMLSARLLGGHARMREEHREVLRFDGRPYAGKAVEQLSFRRDHGVSLIAIARDGRTLARVEPGTVIEPDDDLYICGRREAVRALL